MDEDCFEWIVCLKVVFEASEKFLFDGSKRDGRGSFYTRFSVNNFQRPREEITRKV